MKLFDISINKNSPKLVILPFENPKKCNMWVSIFGFRLLTSWRSKETHFCEVESLAPF